MHRQVYKKIRVKLLYNDNNNEIHFFFSTLVYVCRYSVISEELKLKNWRVEEFCYVVLCYIVLYCIAELSWAFLFSFSLNFKFLVFSLNIMYMSVRCDIWELDRNLTEVLRIVDKYHTQP